MRAPDRMDGWQQSVCDRSKESDKQAGQRPRERERVCEMQGETRRGRRGSEGVWVLRRKPGTRERRGG
eukprot:6178802-Pleurochrysis_carterae.AAC.1